MLLYLTQGGVELEDLTFSLHLSDAQLTAQLTHTHTLTLQSEGAVQPPHRSAPHLRETQLLHTHQITLLSPLCMCNNNNHNNYKLFNIWVMLLYMKCYIT